MDPMLMAAIVMAINIENRSLGFYRAATSKVQDIDTKRVFELLAQEEAFLLEYICTLYLGDWDELVANLNTYNIFADPHYCTLFESFDDNTTGKDALRIALNEEQACMEWYSVFVDTIRVPQIHDVFTRILNETNKHCEIITEEYLHLTNSVELPDQDKLLRE